jgi:hypothetical protein
MKRRDALTFVLLAALSTLPAVAAPSQAVSFDGVWQIAKYMGELSTLAGTEPPLKPDALAIYHQRMAAYHRGDRKFDPTMVSCASPGTPRMMMMPTPFEIIDRPSQITFLFDWNHLFRIVPVGKPPATVGYATAVGNSEARRDRADLVISTDQLNPATLLDAAGLPHSGKLVVQETYHLLDSGNRMTLRLTFNDPDSYTSPWQSEITFKRLPGYQIHEDICLDRIAAGEPAVVEP